MLGRNKRERPGSTKPSAVSESELQEYLSTRNQRRRLFPRAALVGLGAGLVSAAFRAALSGADVLRNSLIVWSYQFKWIGWAFPVLFGAVGAAVSVALVTRFAPEARGSGIPQVEAVLHRLRTLEWKRVLPVKFLAGALAIGGGLTLGREGPTVQMGGSVGAVVADLVKAPGQDRRSLVAAGAGAGLAAAFNAPLAGVIFVVEEIRRDFHPIVFGASFVAAVLADIVVRLILGGQAAFRIPSYPTPPPLSLPFFAILGIAAGLLGVLFNRSLVGTLHLFERVKGPWVLTAAAAVGGLLGLVGWYRPILIGGGHQLTELVLAGDVLLAIVPLYFLLRFVMTVSSYGSGAAGGIFAPLLALGALLGLGVGQVANNFYPSAVPQPAVFAVVGMAALFTAIVRAPLTGIVLIVEMTGNYQQILPLLVSGFCAYAIAEMLADLPIYEALLQLDLRHIPGAVRLEKPLVMDFEIERGAPFAARQVKSLGLPQGCVLVRGVEAGREFIPSATTRLLPHMRITAFISPEAAQAVEMLHTGCKRAPKIGPRDTGT
jgi:CIC family chloride channel protein